MRCKVCGKHFESVFPTAVFCSQECHDESDRRALIGSRAFNIGYRIAERNGSITIPAHCEAMMRLIEKESHNTGDSIPWLKRFCEGQARWFHDEAMSLCEEPASTRERTTL